MEKRAREGQRGKQEEVVETRACRGGGTGEPGRQRDGRERGGSRWELGVSRWHLLLCS